VIAEVVPTPAAVRPVRVLHVIDSLSIGGAEQLLVTFAGEAAAANCEMHVLPLRNPAGSPILESLQSLGVPVHSLGDVRLRDVQRFSALRSLVRQLGIDVVHTHLGLSNTWGTTAAKWAGVPCVATIHNVQDEAQRFGGLKRRLQSFTLKYMTSEVIACAPQVATYVRNRMHVPARRVVQIPNAIDVDAFAHANAGNVVGVRQELLDGRSGPLVISVGTLQVAKGHDVLARAWPAVLEDFPEATLALIGRCDDNEATVRRHIAQLEIGESVRLVGPRSDIPAVYGAADAIVLPSRREGLPLTLLEALAAGKPVVASRVGGIPDVVKHGRDTLLVDPEKPAALAAALISLLHDPALQQALAQEGEKTVRTGYSADRWVEKLVALYRHEVGLA
jgi:glycosyltransferase involved in cell wall biosynthesis